MIQRVDDTQELDVRVIPPRDKHPTIFRTFEALAVGEAFDLVNDHDPFPLRYQFEAERPGEFEWTYLETGPEVWRVRIGRSGEPTGEHRSIPRGGCVHPPKPGALPLYSAEPEKEDR